MGASTMSTRRLWWSAGIVALIVMSGVWPAAAQPFDEPGSLTADQVYAVTAYLLHLNGIIGEQDVMDATTLPLVKMPNRDGFVPDARPDVGQASQQPKR